MGIRTSLACALAGAALAPTLVSPLPSQAAVDRAAPVSARTADQSRQADALVWTGQIPQLTGPKRVGTRLRVKFAFRSSFSPDAQRLYFEWQRYGKPIQGAAGVEHRTYDVKRADRNANIVCVVYGYRDGYRRGLVTSNVVKIART